MKRTSIAFIQRAFLLLVFALSTKVCLSQSPPSIQPVFLAERVNDSIVIFTIKVNMDMGIALFPIKDKEGQLFYSELTFDSTLKISALPKPTIIGNRIKEQQKDGTTLEYYKDSASFTYSLNQHTLKAVTLKGSFSWLAKKNDDYPSGQVKFNIPIKDIVSQVTNPKTEPTNSLWNVFILCFLTGLLAVVTPCVFPLIPVTVSFFLKRGKNKKEGTLNAVFYSLSIILIYTVPTLLLTLLFGDKILYHLSTSPISNLLFFIIFLVFAISFFGAFELSLPNSWANSADKQASKGGLGGIFFMALTLVIVSFSCTGPLVGTLLGQTSSKGASIVPFLGMFGFGLGLSLPFSLFAFFPTMLKSLPKSGGWLNSVKVSFGFIELALALKFLSNIDLAYHWHLLDRDVFLSIWITVFLLLGMYLLGKIRFSHDSPLAYVSVPRLFFALASLCFSIYMIPGLWGAPLKLLSGFIPPETTQEFNLDNLQYSLSKGNNVNSTPNRNNLLAPPPVKYTDKLHVPFGLSAYFDLNEGLAAAKALNKPIMLDFTGHSCANCRKMEEQVWKDKEVLEKIKNDFVLVSLYVDESTELPPSEQYTDSTGNKITTVGGKNLDYEITKFGFNAQPLYMFLDPNGKVLSQIKYGYDPDKEKFLNHLQMVKTSFNK